MSQPKFLIMSKLQNEKPRRIGKAKKQLEKVNENLVFIRKQKKLTQEQFADRIGIKRSALGSYEEGRATPGNDTLIRVSALFGISLDRLLKENLALTADASVFGSDSTMPAANTSAAKESLPYKTKVLALTVDKEGNENIELVPEKASAGYLHGYTDPKYLESLPKFRLPFLPAGTYRAFEIKGDSMLPLTPGSIIIAEYVEEVEDIKNGQTYIILTENEGIVYKRVFLNPELGDTIMLHSDNANYKPYLVNKHDIKELWRAKAFISKEMPNNETTLEKLMSTVFDLQNEILTLKKKMGEA